MDGDGQLDFEDARPYVLREDRAARQRLREELAERNAWAGIAAVCREALNCPDLPEPARDQMRRLLLPAAELGGTPPLPQASPLRVRELAG